MIRDIIKNAAVDVWDEMLYLMIFNIFWIASLIPALFLITQGVNFLFLPFILLGAMLLLLWPLVTFGLIFTVYDIGEAKGIGFGTFWNYIRHTWRQAYVWGGINLVVGAIAWINLGFYTKLEAEWAGLAQMFIVAVSLFWVILQLVTLPFYPRLERPGFKLAVRNAGVAIGRYPLLVILLVILVVLIAALASFFPAILFLGAFSIIAVVTNRVVAAIVFREKLRQQEREAPDAKRL